MSKLIITAALTGAITSKNHTPYVPLTTKEIVREAVRCEEAGATIVHLHLRDFQGQIGLAPELFIELVSEVRVHTNLIICLSTSFWGTETQISDRISGIAAHPDLVSFHVGSMNRGTKLFHNPVEYQSALAEATKRQRIKPEFEIFDLSHLSRALEIHAAYKFPDPFYCQFIMGAAGGCPPQAKHLLHLVESLPSGAVWSVAAVGKAQLPMNLLGIMLDGQIRTGLEDNIYLRKGVLATGNAILVERLVKLAYELNRDIASVSETRAILGLEAV